VCGCILLHVWRGARPHCTCAPSMGVVQRSVRTSVDDGCTCFQYDPIHSKARRGYWVPQSCMVRLCILLLQQLHVGSLVSVPASSPTLMLATVPDRHFGTGSGTIPERHRIGCPGWEYTQTGNSGTVRWYTPNQSELAGLSAGRLAVPSLVSIKALAFGVCE